MIEYLLQYLLIFTSLIIIDGIWLKLMGKFFKKEIAHLKNKSFNIYPAILFYSIYALVILIIIILPALTYTYPITKVLLFGGLLGLASYSAYDLTNLATLKNWSKKLTIIDICLGTAMTAGVSVICFSLLS